MTGRLKRLSSREILRVLKGFGFEVESMRGSHAKLVREGGDGGDGGEQGRREVLVVPIQRTPRIGTVHAIYRQASRFIPEDDLKPHFFG